MAAEAAGEGFLEEPGRQPDWQSGSREDILHVLFASAQRRLAGGGTCGHKALGRLRKSDSWKVLEQGSYRTKAIPSKLAQSFLTCM